MRIERGLGKRTFDVQGIEIAVPRRKVFDFLKQPRNLLRWAHAFISAEDGHARLETPAGAVDVDLSVSADADTGVVDWRLVFPDGGVGLAHSRVTETSCGTSIYTFALHAPPVALEQIEGHDFLNEPVDGRRRSTRTASTSSHTCSQ